MEKQSPGRVHPHIGVDWTALLLDQIDKPWLRCHYEFLATTMLYFIRLDQIKATEALVNHSSKLHADAAIFHRLHAHDLTQLAAQASDAATLRSLLNDDKVAQHIRSAMYHVHTIMKSVTGTDAERSKFQSYFQALRYYHGPAMVFWTLNPRDSSSPLTIRYMAEGLWKEQLVPFNVDELQVHSALDQIRKRNANALSDMVHDDPVAASKCFHTTVLMTFELLFNSTFPKHRGACQTTLHPDGFACQLNPLQRARDECQGGSCCRPGGWHGRLARGWRRSEHVAASTICGGR